MRQDRIVLKSKLRLLVEVCAEDMSSLGGNWMGRGYKVVALVGNEMGGRVRCRMGRCT